MPSEKVDFIISIVGSSLFILLLAAAAVLLFRIYLRRKNRLLLEKERMSIQFEQTLLRSKLEIQEQTFNNISKEIHDNIGQVLSLARINVNGIDASGQESRLQRIDDLLGKAISDLRNLSHSLDSEVIRSAGWLKAAERLFSDLEKTGQYEVSFSTAPALPPLGADKSIILFRMIQEIVNNIIKHAQAGTIDFSAEPIERQLHIRIKDNGRGFDMEKAKKGAGLQNLRSRCSMIGGQMHIASEPGNGTLVTIMINT